MFPVRFLFDKLSLNLRPSASLGVCSWLSFLPFPEKVGMGACVHHD